jgi:phage gpG-like protein
MVKPVLEIDVDPSKAFKRSLVDSARQSSDLRTPFREITASFFKTNKAIFKAKSKQGYFEDLSSKPLYAFWLDDDSPAVSKNNDSKFFPGGYKDLKKKTHGFVYPILKASGRLEESITNPADSDALESVVNKNVLILGTRVPYATWLQEGTKKMPKRPFLLFGNENEGFARTTTAKRRFQRWKEVLEKYCADTLRKGKT